MRPLSGAIIVIVVLAFTLVTVSWYGPVGYWALLLLGLIRVVEL